MNKKEQKIINLIGYGLIIFIVVQILASIFINYQIKQFTDNTINQLQQLQNIIAQLK